MRQLLCHRRRGGGRLVVDRQTGCRGGDTRRGPEGHTSLPEAFQQLSVNCITMLVIMLGRHPEMGTQDYAAVGKVVRSNLRSGLIVDDRVRLQDAS